ncbi:hypothetical protein Tco_0982738, partial [Tanacetum coccineum]
MHTRSQSRNLHHQQHQAPPPVVEQFNLEEPIENPAPPLAPMDDTRTMAQLLEAPTAGYEDAIVVPEITADNFELKHGLLNLVQNTSNSLECNEILMPTSIFHQDHFYEKFPNVTCTSDSLNSAEWLRKVVLLAVVLIPTKLVQPLLAMFIEIIFKNMSLKQLQLTTTKETIRIVTTKTEGISTKLH